VWVFEDNPRAQGFYSRLGFMPDGARHLEDVGGTPVYEIRMVRGAGGGA
jgi:RimJ/RimL family protein N-acetyltransferase